MKLSNSQFASANLTRRSFIVSSAATVALRAFGAVSELDLKQCGVLEFRQYTLRQGKRDALISLFEKQFIAPQNAAGAQVLGTFRDYDDPDRFVWIRGFRDMPDRMRALQAFYGTPVWKENKSAVNAMIVDSNNVVLLRPVPSFRISSAAPSNATADSLYTAMIFYLEGADTAQFCDFFQHSMEPQFTKWNAKTIAQLATEQSPNNYSRLPVREKDVVFVWVARWQNLREHETFTTHFRSWSGWRDAAPEAIMPAFMQKAEVLRLIPTRMSALN